MRTKILFIALILILYFDVSAQQMGDLYKYVIEDYYNEYLKEGYISKQDTMYLTWCLYEYSDNCFYYDIQLDSDKIVFKMPEIDHNYTSAILVRLCLPDLKGQFIQIFIVPYQVTYMGDDEDIRLIFAGSTEYLFKYSRMKDKYIFRSKKEWGI